MGSEMCIRDRPENSLAYTICQVPVVYVRGSQPEIQVIKRDGETEKIKGLKLTRELSQEIFKRTDEVVQLNVRC